MAPIPKDPRLRQRTNVAASRVTIRTGGKRATRPELPRLPDGAKWSELTLRWWYDVWESGLAEAWLQSDVPNLLRVARLDHDFWTVDDVLQRVAIAGRIETLTRHLGLDPMSRRSLQWSLDGEDDEQPSREESAAASVSRDPRLTVVPRARTRRSRAAS